MSRQRKKSKGGGWGKVYRDVVMGGEFRPIGKKSSALAVFLAYSAHVNADGEAWLGEASIMAAFGISAESVRKGRRAAEAAGVLIDTGKCENRCKVYRVKSKPQRPLGGEGEATPNAGASEPPTGKGPNPNGRPSEPPTGVGTNRRNRRTDSNSAPDDAGDAAVGALRNELKACGFAATDLATVEAEALAAGWTPAEVAELRRTKPTRCGPGWVRKRLRDPAALEAVREALDSERRREVDHRASERDEIERREVERNEEAAQKEREEQQLQRYFALTESEREALHERVNAGKKNRLKDRSLALVAAAQLARERIDRGSVPTVTFKTIDSDDDSADRHQKLVELRGLTKEGQR